MIPQLNSLVEMLETFPTEQSCIDYFTSIRWQDAVSCLKRYMATWRLKSCPTLTKGPVGTPGHEPRGRRDSANIVFLRGM